MLNQKDYNVSVTEKAAEQIKLQLKKRGTPEAYLRLGLKGGGCSGLYYIIQYEDSPPNIKDLIFQSYDVNIIVDSKSIIYLNGTVLDWEETLINRGFKFINPNQKTACGCGKSFST